MKISPFFLCPGNSHAVDINATGTTKERRKKKKAEQIKLLLMLHVLQTHNKQTETYLNRVTERPTTDESKKGGKTKEKGIVLSTLTSKMSAYDRCCLTNSIDP